MDSLIEKRRLNADYFIEMMSEFDFIDIQKETGASSWFGFSLILNDKANFTRADLVHRLNSRGIETRPIVCGNILENEMTQYFDFSTSGNFAVSENIHANGLFIGNHHTNLHDGLANLHEVLCQSR